VQRKVARRALTAFTVHRTAACAPAADIQAGIDFALLQTKA
jgi:hypothetical protein